MENNIHIKINQPLTGDLYIPGDKSISHRAIILGALAEGTTIIDNFLDGEDCLRTIEIFRQMGVNIKQDGTVVIIKGNGKKALKKPIVPLNLVNSGTIARLMLGL